ncbi:WD repeat-containing protein on Y chromosome-like [Brachyistius frenatus]|uniref:WD repeat-containing protein on Y chromosome-like n=1 Tax=Brachyistius frenatus TaxID=100188 RepID=UPI0037E7FE52
MEEELPKDEDVAASEAANATAIEQMFNAEDTLKIVALFHEADADGSGGLDIDEFCEAMVKLYSSVSFDHLLALHMMIDTNCDGAVDLGELLHFVWQKEKASEKLDFNNILFPKPVTIVPLNDYRKIVGFLCPAAMDEGNFNKNLPGKVSPYRKRQYVTITADGILKYWSNDFRSSHPIDLREDERRLPYTHRRKMEVSDVLYIKQVKELVVSSSDREMYFYHFGTLVDVFRIKYSLTEKDHKVTALSYWCKNKKSIFAFCDSKGFLSVFISHDVESNGLFDKGAFYKDPRRDHATAYVSHLLTNPSKDFYSLRLSIFDEACGHIQSFPGLGSFGICSKSSKEMTIVTLIFPDKLSPPQVSQTDYTSEVNKEFFTCVDYSNHSENIVTGGTDGVLRTWKPGIKLYNNLEGHENAITRIVYNPKDQVLITFSADSNLRVWSDHMWYCLQSFDIKGMNNSPITSMFYDFYNNELFLANTDIARSLGRGTDVLKSQLTSHDKPICCMLYHRIFKQVVTVCLDGLVVVWETETGRITIQFTLPTAGLTTMAFDEPQRKLITVSQDGKVRLWNFNNALQLDVLSVTVPSKVTGVICRGERLYVSAQNSEKIFDLDLEGNNNQCLTHHLLCNVVSMDLHEPTLMTVSCDRNVVVWNLKNRDVLYCIRMNENPRAMLAGKNDQGHVVRVAPKTGDRRLKSSDVTEEISVDVDLHILCLKSRENDIDTATMLSTMDGHVYAWSMKIKGGLIGKFKAVKDDGATITSMTTDPGDYTLLTGHSTGHVSMWDIQSYGFKTEADAGPFENVQGRQVSLLPPPLLRSWQAHRSKVVSIVWASYFKIVITATLNYNIKVWTKTGGYMGILRRDQWDAEQIKAQEEVTETQDDRALTPEKETVRRRAVKHDSRTRPG